MRDRADVASLILARVGDAYRLARAILLDDGEAEDAVQEATLAAWRKKGSLRDPARFDVWFERILVNQCRDQLRRRKRSVRLAAPPVGFQPAAEPIDTGTDADLDAAIAALTSITESSWSCATGRTGRWRTSRTGSRFRPGLSSHACTTR